MAVATRAPWSPSACPGPSTVHRPVADGWTTRDLGAPLPLQRGHRTEDTAGRWHGQHAQDRIVATLLGEKRGGFFLDMAASEPFMHSNTRTFERDYGWDGVCIEANEHFWHRLVSWRRCCVVGAAVAEKRAEEGYHFYGPYAGCGGFVRSGTDNAGRREVLRVLAVPLSEILQRFAVPRTIDFMSLDVEGAESLVMAGFPFDTHTVSVLLIEVCQAKTAVQMSPAPPLTRLQHHTAKSATRTSECSTMPEPASHPRCHRHPPVATAAQARSRGEARESRLPLPLHERGQLRLRAGSGVAIGLLRARRRRRRRHAAHQLLPTWAHQPSVHGAVRDAACERVADGGRTDERLVEGSLMLRSAIYGNLVSMYDIKHPHLIFEPRSTITPPRKELQVRRGPCSGGGKRRARLVRVATPTSMRDAAAAAVAARELIELTARTWAPS